MHQLILWLCLLLPTFAMALVPTSQQECSFVDNRNDTLGAVRDQKEVSWCYAFTAADMLAHAFNIKESISPAEIALNYNDTRTGRLIRWFNLNVLARKDEETRMSVHETGLSKIAFIRTMHHGYCPEDVFPSEEWVKVTRSGQSWVRDRQPLRESIRDIAALHRQRFSWTAENLPYYFEFHQVGISEFLGLLQGASRIEQFYSALRGQVCAGQIIALDKQWKVKMSIKRPRIFQRISRQLELGRLVAIDYDGRILADRHNRGVKVSELHTSSIVARRWNESSGRCQFLIRNSYGAGCDRYDPTYECDQGQIWMDEQLLYPNMTSIVYLLHGFEN
jgi:hypothetical protein